MKLNDCVKSKKTGNKGILQATYPDGKFLLYHGKGYEHLFEKEMESISEDEIPFRIDLYRVHRPAESSGESEE